MRAFVGCRRCEYQRKWDNGSGDGKDDEVASDDLLPREASAGISKYQSKGDQGEEKKGGERGGGRKVREEKERGESKRRGSCGTRRRICAYVESDSASPTTSTKLLTCGLLSSSSISSNVAHSPMDVM